MRLLIKGGRGTQVALLGLLLCGPLHAANSTGPINIGSRRELFVDKALIESMSGSARLTLNAPQLAPKVPNAQPEQPWGNVFQEENTYKMVVRSLKDPAINYKKDGIPAHYLNHVLRYFESKDGVHWHAPALGLYSLPQFPEGNVIMADKFGVEQTFAAFLDTRPGAPASERYKGLGGKHYPEKGRAELIKQYGPDGLQAFVSPDAIHWVKRSATPVIPPEWGFLDSQNIVFWSEHENKYICYFRTFNNSHARGLRSVNRTTSTDFLNWSNPVEVVINGPKEELYTSNIEPYLRAPHIYIGFPTRYMAKRGSATDILFVSSRDGLHFSRPVGTAYIRPGLEKAAWGNRANYAAYHIMQTSPTELSLYVSGGRRYVTRVDGFASVNTHSAGGEMVTKPLIFSGKKLSVNYSTSAAGALAIEIQDAAGVALPGFTLAECKSVHGDEIDRVVSWKDSTDLSKLVGKSVRLRFVMNEADLYSLKFD